MDTTTSFTSLCYPLVISCSFSLLPPMASSSFLKPPTSTYLSSPRATPAYFSGFPCSLGWRRRPSGGVLLRPLASGGGSVDFLGDFGARDPFPQEVESNFGDKVIANTDTMHRILIPNISALSLAQMSCEPLSPSQPPLSADDAQKLLKKVVGWRVVVQVDGGARLQCLWKVRDYECGIELINRINQVAEAAGHKPNLHLEEPNQVTAQLWSASLGGLSMNDFIVAAKIDQIKTSDLLPKKRAWA